MLRASSIRATLRTMSGEMGLERTTGADKATPLMSSRSKTMNDTIHLRFGKRSAMESPVKVATQPSLLFKQRRGQNDGLGPISNQ